MSDMIRCMAVDEINSHAVKLHRTAAQDDQHRMSAFKITVDGASVLSGRMSRSAADHAYRAVLATIKQLS